MPGREEAWRALDSAHRAIPDCWHNREWWQQGPGRPEPPDCEHNQAWRAAIDAARKVHLMAIEIEEDMSTITYTDAIELLQTTYKFKHDRAERALEIAQEIGFNSTPVAGGLITITYRGRDRDSWHRRRFSVEEHTHDSEDDNMVFKMSPETTAHILQEKYGFSSDRADRILEIARDNKLNNVPVTGGFITVKYRFTHTSNLRYSVEEHTHDSPRGKVAALAGKDYNQGNANEPSTARKGKTMPPRGRKPAPAPEPETAEEAEDFSRYLEKDLSPTMTDFVVWFENNVADLSELDTDRILALGTTLYPKFQKSQFNIDQREARRAAREAGNGSEPEEEAAQPVRGRGRPAKSAEPAEPAKPTRGRGRQRATAGASASSPY